MSGLIESAMLAWFILSLGTWLSVILAAVTKQYVWPRPQAVSSWSVRGWLYAPFWVPSVLLCIAMFPAINQENDHCILQHATDLHHHHLCLSHPPHASGDLFFICTIIIAIASVIFVISHKLKNISNSLNKLNSLFHFSQKMEGYDDIKTINHHRPIAITFGFVKPVILLSQSLIEKVDEETLKVIIAHERAHVRRHDTRAALADESMAALFPRQVARQLLDMLYLAREQACDAAAAKELGDPVKVARALTKVARLGLEQPAAALSIASSSLELRVHSLLLPTKRSRNWIYKSMLCVALVVMSAEAIHSGLEHLTSLLLH